MKERRPTINNIDKLQEVQGHFSGHINPDATPHGIQNMLEGEVQELRESLVTRDREKIGGEIADVIIFAVELANQHAISVKDVISAKIHRNYYKYSPLDMQELIAKGMTPPEARKQLKNKWDKTRDQDFK